MRACQSIMPPTLRYPVKDRNTSNTEGLPSSVSGTDYARTMGIGRKLKERRVELGLSVKQVADAAGMAATTLYDLEREEQHSTTRLHALCKVLGLNPEWADSGRGPRLVGSPTLAPDSVPQDQEQVRAGTDMASVMREALEVAILLSSLSEPIRSNVIGMVRALATARRDRDGQDDHTLPPPPPALDNAKSSR
jgi:transcriptional regulator with XRE-family HTH domain